MPTPLEMLIDKACGVNEPPKPRVLTAEEKEACARLGRDVLSDLRNYYPEVTKTRPTTWPIHLRNTVAAKAEMMLRGVLENEKLCHEAGRNETLTPAVSRRPERMRKPSTTLKS